MITVLSALFKGIFEAVTSGLWSLLASWTIFRRGEQVQQGYDLKEAVGDAEQANQISTAVGTLDHDQLVKQLRDEQTNRKRLFLGKTD